MGTLGGGGWGRVSRAHHTRIASKQFAIKVLKPEFTRNPDVVARFRREAEAAACISHPNVVGVYDVDTSADGHSYMVCEYLKGRDLAEEIAQAGWLGIGAAVHVVIEVCKALEAAHARGVVHRDLKPHNVFLLADETGEVPARPVVRVLDFGLSRFVDAPGTQLTQTGGAGERRGRSSKAGASTSGRRAHGLPRSGQHRSGLARCLEGPLRANVGAPTL